MCDTMMQEGHSMIMYPTLFHVSATKSRVRLELNKLT